MHGITEGLLGVGRDVATTEPSRATHVVAWYGRRSQAIPLVGEVVTRFDNRPRGLIQEMTQAHSSVRAGLRRRELLKAELRRQMQGNTGTVSLSSFREWMKEHLPSASQLLFLRGGLVVVDFIATVSYHYEDDDQWMLVPPMRFIFSRDLQVFKVYGLKDGHTVHASHPHASENVCFGNFDEMTRLDAEPEVWLMTMLGALRQWRQAWSHYDVHQAPFDCADTNEQHYHNSPRDFEPIEDSNGEIFANKEDLNGSGSVCYVVAPRECGDCGRDPCRCDDYCTRCDEYECCCDSDRLACGFCDDNIEGGECVGCYHIYCEECGYTRRCGQSEEVCSILCASMTSHCRCEICPECNEVRCSCERCQWCSQTVATCFCNPINRPINQVSNTIIQLVRGVRRCGCGSFPEACAAPVSPCDWCHGVCGQVVEYLLVERRAAALRNGITSMMGAAQQVMRDGQYTACLQGCNRDAVFCSCDNYTRCNPCRMVLRFIDHRDGRINLTEVTDDLFHA
jgi:hypothetical protein